MSSSHSNQFDWGSPPPIKVQPKKSDRPMSFSQLTYFEQCKAKWMFLYGGDVRVDGIGSEASRFGIGVHDILAVAYQKLKDEKYDGELDEERLGLHTDAILAKELSKRKLYSSDRLEDLRAILETVVRLDGWKFNHKAMLGLEQRFLMDLDGVPKPWKGFIDRVERIDRETVVVLDYKTGRSPGPPEEDHKAAIAGTKWKGAESYQDQLRLYSIPTMLKYPWANLVEIRVWFVKTGDVYWERLDREMVLGFESGYAKRGMAVIQAKEYPYNVTKLCRWCDARLICPAFEKMTKSW